MNGPKNPENNVGEVWTLAERREGRLHGVSFELLAWGRELADKKDSPLASVVLGHGVSDEDAASLIRGGADKVYVIDEPQLAQFLPDAYKKSIADLVRKYRPDIFIASATSQGRTIMPTLYAALGTGLTADCTGLDIEPGTGMLIQTRPAIGGNVMAEIRTPDRRPQMCTVRPKSRRPLAPDTARTGQVVRHRPADESLASVLERLSFRGEPSIGLPIQEAEIIVAGGKGMKKARNFRTLEELAGLLGGSVGASRMAVDLGWVPYSAQVGLSGKSVTPRLYIACGISGAVQHLAGMSGAERVIAINQDPEAPIFNSADISIVGDAMDVLPRLITEIKSIKNDRAAGGAVR
ncbi:MAG: electron transfer flavoprotein subunit alpha/FixB family protein [Synergistaceae bacterium]|jgi:electron transfer flavoprotein alpha subunit|nr:electron transfer flavoprotein subunit alpha/FixB family protein [Synergistaceae bacterium]